MARLLAVWRAPRAPPSPAEGKLGLAVGEHRCAYRASRPALEPGLLGPQAIIDCRGPDGFDRLIEVAAGVVVKSAPVSMRPTAFGQVLDVAGCTLVASNQDALARLSHHIIA